MRKQHYWNRASFEGLAALAATLGDDPRLEPLARYCALRVKGLRRQALAELDTFLARAESWDAPARRAVALRVLDAHRRVPQAHPFLAEPLRRRFLEPTLEEWRAAEPGDPLPLRHLALLRRDGGLLREALRLDPADDEVRAALAGILLGFVDFATHHLAEGSFIGDEAEAEEALAEAAALLAGASDRALVRPLEEDARDLGDLLADWREYRQAPRGPFPEWCRERGRSHRWWSVYRWGGGDGE